MNVSCVVGTRPEVVKMAPVILRLRRALLDEVRILSTGQHRSLVDRALADFGLAADDDLEATKGTLPIAVAVWVERGKSDRA
jgi:UDP-N-acetylglucosamine 2-epimerase (non-hydrolysing)